MGLIGFRSNTTKSIRYPLGPTLTDQTITTPLLFNPFGSADWIISYHYTGSGQLFSDAQINFFNCFQEPATNTNFQVTTLKGDGIINEKILCIDNSSIPFNSSGSIYNYARVGLSRQRLPITSELFRIVISFINGGATGREADLWLSGA